MGSWGSFSGSDIHFHNRYSLATYVIVPSGNVGATHSYVSYPNCYRPVHESCNDPGSLDSSETKPYQQNQRSHPTPEEKHGSMERGSLTDILFEGT